MNLTSIQVEFLRQIENNNFVIWLLTVVSFLLDFMALNLMTVTTVFFCLLTKTYSVFTVISVEMIVYRQMHFWPSGPRDLQFRLATAPKVPHRPVLLAHTTMQDRLFQMCPQWCCGLKDGDGRPTKVLLK